MCPRYKMWHCLMALLHSGEKVPAASTGSQASASSGTQEVDPCGDRACGGESARWPRNDRSDLSPAHARVAMGPGRSGPSDNPTAGPMVCAGCGRCQATLPREEGPEALTRVAHLRVCDRLCEAALGVSDSQDDTEQVSVPRLRGCAAARPT